MDSDSTAGARWLHDAGGTCAWPYTVIHSRTDLVSGCGDDEGQGINCYKCCNGRCGHCGHPTKVLCGVDATDPGTPSCQNATGLTATPNDPIIET